MTPLTKAERDHAYYIANKERIKAKVAEYQRLQYSANPDFGKERYAREREQQLLRTKLARLRDPEGTRKRDRERYHRRKQIIRTQAKARYERNKPALLIRERERRKSGRYLVREMEYRRGKGREMVLKAKRDYYRRHKVRLTEHWKRKRDARRAIKAAYDKDYRKSNVERIRARLAEWYRENRDKQNAYCRMRRATDPQYAVKNNLRSRMNTALRNVGIKRDYPLEKLLGCTVTSLMAHIESQFVPGMSWSNRCDWHIDHRIPCAEFDLTKPKQQKMCFHYTNLQPLWKRDNAIKGDKVLRQAEIPI